MSQKKLNSAIILVTLLTIFHDAQSLQRGYHDDHMFNQYYGTNESSCPPWFMYDGTTKQCECGDSLGGLVNCNSEDKIVYIINCYCMTQDDLLGVAVGSCFTNCYLGKSNSTFEMYYQLPNNPSELNAALCEDRWNRGGRFCGECKDGFYPLVYAYDMKCKECTDNEYNWLKFVIEAFLPLTVFFIVVVSSGISASSPQLDAFVVYAQTIATPANVRMVLEASHHHPTTALFCRLVSALYGVWNLDFFRTLLPPICLKISTLQALALDYLIAIYPLILIAATYIIIDLHDRHFCPLIWLWKPFKRCLKSFSCGINVKSSIINAFVTFLLLSYVKFLSVSFDLLAFVKAYTPNGKVSGIYLFYDASIEYFGKEHLPYGILAITVLILFIVLPLMLSLLHPLRCINRCIGRWPSLRICFDSYQGYYKDGTEGTHDYRWFSSLYLFARIVLFLVYGFVKNSFFYPFASILLLFLVALIVVCQPFKTQFRVYNIIHALLFLNLAMWFVTVICTNISVLKTSYLDKFSLALSGCVGILPLLYITGLVLKWIYWQKIFQKCLVKYNCNFFHHFRKLRNTHQDEEYDSFLHRVEHSNQERVLCQNFSNCSTSGYGTFQD